MSHTARTLTGAGFLGRGILPLTNTSTNKTMTDYNKVLRSFIHFQEAVGFKLVSASDGEDRIKNPSTAQAVDWVLGTEEGSLSFNKDGHGITAYVIIGNEASATIYDFGNSKDIPAKTLKESDDAWTAWMDKWDALEA